MDQGIANSRKVIDKALRSGKFDLDLVPDYLVEGDEICLEMVFKDLYMSIVHLANQVDILKKENDKWKGEVDHLGHHVVALECNLRTLRHTIICDSIVDSPLPPMDTCHLAGGTIGE